MKKTLTLLLLAISTGTFAQFDFMPKASQGNFEIGSVPAITVTVYESNINDAEKEWRSILKKMDGKLSGKASEIMADNVNYPELSNTPVDIYSQFKESDGNVILTVAVDLGTGMLTPGDFPNKFNVMKGLMHTYAVSETKEGVQMALKTAQKQLKNDEQELEKLEKEKEKLEKDIKNWQEDIENAKKEIEKNIEAQGKQKQVIEKQSTTVGKIEQKEKSIN